MSSTTSLKVGIVGLHHLHPRSYMTLFKNLPEAQVTCVCEADGALREPFCKEFNLRGYAGVQEMLKAQTLDIAAIFLPHADCPDAAAQCAAAGVHLMVEKPMAASSRGAAKIVEAARKHRVLLTTGYVWRLHPVAREMRKLIREGAIGQVVGAEGRCAAGRLQRYIDGHAPWILQKARSGGGPMYNLGVHWIDLFRWILDDEVAEVSGRNVKVNARFDVEDNSFAHLRFGGGAIAALDISYTVPDAFPFGRDLYLSIRGTRGVLSWAPAYEGQKDELFICSDHASFRGSPRVHREYELQSTPGYSGYMGQAYVQAFIHAVQHRSTPPITGEDGVAALRVVEAIYRADARKRWVDVEQEQKARVAKGKLRSGAKRRGRAK
jgi:predicted dehydrogenase